MLRFDLYTTYQEYTLCEVQGKYVMMSYRCFLRREACAFLHVWFSKTGLPPTRCFLPHRLGYKGYGIQAHSVLILMSPEPSEKYVALRIKIKMFP